MDGFWICLGGAVPRMGCLVFGGERRCWCDDNDGVV